MADTFAIKPDKGTRNRIRKVIAARIEGCYHPRCWTLKDTEDTGQLYLGKKLIVGGHGRYVQIRRVLYYLAYGEVPDMKRITMRCGNNKCCNPAHTKVKGQSHDVVVDLERKMITLDQIHDLYLHEGEPA
jgi:hypothetical protein